MGVKGFSKAFESKITTLKKLKNLSGAVDASVYLYKAALGASSTHTLTDPEGNPTLHLSVILSKVINFALCNIDQIWVFDYHEEGYQPPDKKAELAIRKKKRDEATAKLKKLKAEKEAKDKKDDNKKKKNKGKDPDELFTDDEDEPEEKTISPISKKTGDKQKETKEKDLEKMICQKEKECFSMSTQMVNECKFILDCLDITWVDAPKGIEAEQVCAELTNTDDLDFCCDCVFSTDVDTLIYGAQQLIREVNVKKKKVLQFYSLMDILDDNKIDIDDLRKIAVILGTDHAPKTAGIGPGTVLKKYENVELSDEQKNAVKVFEKTFDITKLKFSNDFEETEIAQDKTKITKLLDWLSGVKSFNRKKLIEKISKVYSDEDNKLT